MPRLSRRGRTSCTKCQRLLELYLMFEVGSFCLTATGEFTTNSLLDPTRLRLRLSDGATTHTVMDGFAFVVRYITIALSRMPSMPQQSEMELSAQAIRYYIHDRRAGTLAGWMCRRVMRISLPAVTPSGLVLLCQERRTIRCGRS